MHEGGREGRRGRERFINITGKEKRKKPLHFEPDE